MTQLERLMKNKIYISSHKKDIKKSIHTECLKSIDYFRVFKSNYSLSLNIMNEQNPIPSSPHKGILPRDKSIRNISWTSLKKI